MGHTNLICYTRKTRDLVTGIGYKFCTLEEVEYELSKLSKDQEAKVFNIKGIDIDTSQLTSFILQNWRVL